VPDPPAAAELDDDAGAEAAGDEPAGDELDDELELHPAINAAITATATPPAAMRARPTLDMVLIAPLERKAHEPI
jgi:hypothetical protein